LVCPEHPAEDSQGGAAEAKGAASPSPDLSIRDVPSPFHPEPAPQSFSESGGWTRVRAYLLHGFGLSLALLTFSLIWELLDRTLLICGAWLGLIVGVFLFVIGVAWMNALITEWMWEIPVRMDWKSTASHGLLLFILMQVSAIPSYIIQDYYPGISSIIMFLAFCPIYGFLGKLVAGSFTAT